MKKFKTIIKKSVPALVVLVCMLLLVFAYGSDKQVHAANKESNQNYELSKDYVLKNMELGKTYKENAKVHFKCLCKN